jgi:cell division protein FtsB
LRKEIDELQQENARLRDHIERLKSDPDAIEHEAREKLHYAKPGEVIYTLPTPAAGQAQPAAPGK